MVSLKLKGVLLSRLAKMKRVCLNLCLLAQNGIILLKLLNFADKGVPDFWLTAMKNNEVLAEEVC